MNEPANDNGKKPRKQRVKGPKAPNKKANPGQWAAYQLERAGKIVQRINNVTAAWPGRSEALTDALDFIELGRAEFAGMSNDFKAPRKPRAKKDLQVSEDSGTV